jgi:hypothetical protein
MKYVAADKILVGTKYTIHDITVGGSGHTVRVQDIHIPHKQSKYPIGLCSLFYLGPCFWPKQKQKSLYLTDYGLTWWLRYQIE